MFSKRPQFCGNTDRVIKPVMKMYAQRRIGQRETDQRQLAVLMRTLFYAQFVSDKNKRLSITIFFLIFRIYADDYIYQMSTEI